MGLGQLHCSAVLSNQGSKEGDTVGTSPSSTSWALSATALVGHADLPALPSQMMAAGCFQWQESLPQSQVMTWEDFITAKSPGCPEKSLSHSVHIQKIFDGLKSGSSLCTCRVSLSGCWGWGTLPAWESLSNWSLLLTETQVPGEMEDH